MTASLSDFYDKFAGDYHLIFENWEASMTRQAAAIASILHRECPAADTTVLDCACGIGTQTLGLARLGFSITGSDVSTGAVERARSEAALRSLDVPFFVADMRNLDELPAGEFHAVICMDNALPHLLSDPDIAQAADQVRGKLRSGGIFIASIRDYDEILAQRPVVQGPVFYSDAGKRRIVFQLWDWQDERLHIFHMYITRETSTGWANFHGASVYRAVLRDEITSILKSRGFTNIRWRFPRETGFYQSIVIATAAAA
ncbi:MAG TPA: class I SAM-dependent methyltransferase [Bryobacteraceae bacterium]|nr:class I SAM-dependent methyltransferase [Bryobacteraceae bacterium]